ncbi:hypothetical protein ACM6Q7_13465 [Peribacillus butanolivorans]|uniref:hypothetical protein n=1 Tax=Peribacillus butanolivorans TaxID=421767 RepID=UPI0039FD34EA
MREVNSNMVTINMEGIYAAGDICTYERKIKLHWILRSSATPAVGYAKVYN